MVRTGKLSEVISMWGCIFGHPHHGGYLTEIEYGVWRDSHIIAVYGGEWTAHLPQTHPLSISARRHCRCRSQAVSHGAGH
jgi:hypothetical protein